MNKPTTTCNNLNHRRSDPKVRHCPNCGDLMNATISIAMCSGAKHAERRQARHDYCMDCGKTLID